MRELLEWLRDQALARGVQFADARYVVRSGAGITVQDGRADSLGSGYGEGVGVRVLFNGAWGFGSANWPDRERAATCLEQALQMAKEAAAHASQEAVVAQVEPVRAEAATSVAVPPASVPLERKVALISGLEGAARARAGDKVANTVFSYSEGSFKETICNTFGTLVTQTATRVMVSGMVVAADGQTRQVARERKGALAGFELAESISTEAFALAAADRALALLAAKRAPAGVFPVVMDPTFTGLFVHEALGHNAEADIVLEGGSIIEGKMGQKIGAECVTIVDDGTVPGSWGSYAYDSEGTPSQRRVIVEKGMLKGYMHSLETAGRMGVAPNGSARADGYGSVPIVRMSNTYIEPGAISFEDLIADIEVGVLLCGGEWGYVFCERGQFTGHAGEAFMIRDGQVAERVRDVSISGMTLQTLEDMVGLSRDFVLEFPGTCGKNGQGAPVNGGGPYLKVRQLVVGGQEAGGG